MNEDEGTGALLELLAQFLFFYLIVVPPMIKIIAKTGLSRWLGLVLILGPIGNFILLPILAFRRWNDGAEENA